ncbi:hypothetical protein [Micromonospora violae]|uniref:hypothetical protein n=1 Tax=Micromonospora violae TaxID=1278207 RepID=UPI0033F7F501
MPPGIRHDDTRLEEARTNTNKLRVDINSVRSGFNPNDVGHPHGLPFNNLTVAAGGDAFPSGVNFEAKVKEVGGAIDKLLQTHEGSLARLTRALTINLQLGDDAELRNLKTANTVGLPSLTTNTTNTNTTSTNTTNTTNTNTSTTKAN